MKNEEKKTFQKQKLNKEMKKPIRKNMNQKENNNKHIKKTSDIKNNMSNIYKIATGTTLFSDNNNKKEKDESVNSFEGKIFYEVNNKNTYNNPIKTINVYRNNFFNYTNNNMISNLLCDVSDDNKNVMVSELDLNISNSQAPTPRPDIIQQPQKRFLEKQNTEIDFKSQLETNIIKILEKNAINNKNNYKINEDKKNECRKTKEENKNINIINLNKLKVNKEENKNGIINKNKSNIKMIDNKINNQNSYTKYLSKMSNKEIKNKYFVSSPKSRKSRGLKSPNMNIHKVNSIISPSNKKYGNKKIFFNNYTKTDIYLKKYKTIIENNNTNSNCNNKNNTKTNSIKFYNQIKSKNKKYKIQTQNTTSKKAMKSYIIYNSNNIDNNKIIYSNNNNRHLIYKLNKKSKDKNILLTNNSNIESTSNNEKMNYSKYKNLLNELQKNLSVHFQKNEEKNSKPNSHRSKQNQTYLIFNLENNNCRKRIKNGEIISSNTNNTINNKYNLNSLKNINNKNWKIKERIEENEKSIIKINHSIDHNLYEKHKNINCLTKQNSDNNLLYSAKKIINNTQNDNEKEIKLVNYEKNRPNKNNSCQLNQKLSNILSDSLFNASHKLTSEKNKYKYNNNLSLFGIEKINIEINQKNNNSNIEINPKDLLKETNMEKEKAISNKKLNNSQIKKKESDFSDIINKRLNKKEIINKNINDSNYKYNSNSKSNNKNNIKNNMISFRNKFINNISIKKHLSLSKDKKEKKNTEKQKYQKLNNKDIKNYFHNTNNININYKSKYNYNYFSPINIIKCQYKDKSNKKILKAGNKINIDINFNNNINYIYIIKTSKSRFNNKSNNHFCTMK